mmetsp:Transcript_119998/g.208916  ORF Transcript_119998/g.208916 Transcript_119998/m.208916 type:complete len:211 (+) Transcript_119998:267-899(+)
MEWIISDAGTSFPMEQWAPAALYLAMSASSELPDLTQMSPAKHCAWSCLTRSRPDMGFPGKSILLSTIAMSASSRVFWMKRETSDSPLRPYTWTMHEACRSRANCTVRKEMAESSMQHTTNPEGNGDASGVLTPGPGRTAELSCLQIGRTTATNASNVTRSPSCVRVIEVDEARAARRLCCRPMPSDMAFGDRKRGPLEQFDRNVPGIGE